MEQQKHLGANHARGRRHFWIPSSNMNEPLFSQNISVCIAARNEQNTIRHAIQASLIQLTPADELLVCVNGSTDSTEEIVSAFSSHDSRVRLLFSLPGKAAAWNVLMSQSENDNLVFLDADVIPLSGSIPTLVQFMKDHTLVAATPTMRKIVVSESRLSRLWNYPPDTPLDDGIMGCMYALTKGAFCSAMRAHGYNEMPTDIINEDHWIQLIVEKRRNGKIVYQNWGYCRAAVVLYQPSTFFDDYRQEKRITLGKLQLEQKHPDLGYTRSLLSEFATGASHTRNIKAKIHRKRDLLVALDSPLDRFLMPFISALRSLRAKSIASAGLIGARIDRLLKRQDWGYAKSSKRTLPPEVIKIFLSQTNSSRPTRMEK